MFDNSPSYVQARQVALALLRGESNPTLPVIRDKVAIAIDICGKSGIGGDIDADLLLRDIESSCSVWIDSWSVLESKEGHLAWLPDKRAKIEWKFWRRYQRYLEEEIGWSPIIVNHLDELTDSILERLEDPGRQAPWDRRGMVVGSVQSGKTANYIGLICKAIDAGYKLIIVLTGMHNSLRSQTQLRIDESVLGFDSQKSRRFNQDNEPFGVGRLLPRELLTIHSLTNSEETGDFRRDIANTINVMPGGGDPVILVIKKNKSVMRNLIQWVLAVRGQMDPSSGRRIIHNVPLLLIDDEADNASINTRPVPDDTDDYDVTAINEKIRELLSSFDKSAYVGSTATPFANIFINPDCTTQRLGDDIFPRSFIINISPSSEYVGPARVFGLDSDPDAGIEGAEPLPIVRIIDDYEDDFPDRHKSDHVVNGLPESMREAIKTFILTCAARRARGQVSAHNSMLIHVTRFVAVQRQVAEMVRAELTNLRRRISYGDGKSPYQILEEFESLWRADFEPTSEKMSEFVPRKVTWDEVQAELHAAVAKIDVKEINGTAKDVLDYIEHPSGRSVIAIGGDKLSRGLTLEGLSVSYYLRSSRMYDTLMQMGRWFGYRPGYLDLCRLYTTDELVTWYRHITLADQELRREFDYMVASGLTPEDYGLRVRTHPEGLLITAVNKMRSGVTMQLSYAGDLVETAHFHADARVVNRNFEATEEFIASLGSCETVGEGGHRLWRRVPAARIIDDFLTRQEIHPDAIKANPRRLSDYIRAQQTQGELVNWTVALISNKQKSTPKVNIGGQEVGLTSREDDSSRQGVYSLKKSHILSPTDQYLDFDKPSVDEALRQTVEGWREGKIRGKNEPKIPNGRIVREMRSPEDGLLIIYPLNPEKVKKATGPDPITRPVVGFAISFPTSERARTIEYRVTKRYLDLEYESDDE